jgi:hypothetical protein
MGTEMTLEEMAGQAEQVAPYAWIIDFDHVTDHTDPEDSAVGVCGPRNADERLIHNLRSKFADNLYEGLGEIRRFRLLDDDGNIYYYGRIIDTSDECLHAPLDDFGTPNAGCTNIEYFEEQEPPETHEYQPARMRRVWVEL